MTEFNVGASDLFGAAGLHMLKTKKTRQNDYDCDASAAPSKSSKRSRMHRVTFENSVGAEPEYNATMTPLSWQELQQNTHTEYQKKKCWACANSDHGKNRDLYPTVAGLFDLFYKEYHCRDLTELCEMVHQYHESEIRAKYLRRGEDCIEFTKEMIEDHFLKHALNPSIEIGQQLRQLQTLEKLMRNQVSKKNAETGEIVPDLRHIDMLLKIQKQTQSTLLLNTKTMNFHDENSSVIK